MHNRPQKITPHLWFDREAKLAAEFYVGAFAGDSSVTSTIPITDTPSGDVERVTFRLLGYEFIALSAGPMFRINPAVSFIVNFDPSRQVNADAVLNRLWAQLAEGGSVLMPLDRYPFSECYGWLQDRYGVSWQLVLTNPDGQARPAIIPSLMFTRDMCGKAEEAMKCYTSIFAHSQQGQVVRYGPGQTPAKEGTVLFEDFALENQWFAGMDSTRSDEFGFNEAVSLLVSCESQAEIDYYWARLSAVPQAEQCGWLKDRYGLSWQITPKAMGEFLGGSDVQGRQRAIQAMLKMKKIELIELEKAYRGV